MAETSDVVGHWDGMVWVTNKQELVRHLRIKHRATTDLLKQSESFLEHFHGMVHRNEVGVARHTDHPEDER